MVDILYWNSIQLMERRSFNSQLVAITLFCFFRINHGAFTQTFTRKSVVQRKRHFCLFILHSVLCSFFIRLSASLFPFPFPIQWIIHSNEVIEWAHFSASFGVLHYFWSFLFSGKTKSNLYSIQPWITSCIAHEIRKIAQRKVCSMFILLATTFTIFTPYSNAISILWGCCTAHSKTK